jgi:hypothetical protein
MRVCTRSSFSLLLLIIAEPTSQLHAVLIHIRLVASWVSLIGNKYLVKCHVKRILSDISVCVRLACRPLGNIASVGSSPLSCLEILLLLGYYLTIM